MFGEMDPFRLSPSNTEFDADKLLRMTNLAGSGSDDIRVWNTYLFWALEAHGSPIPASLDIAKQENRLDARRAGGLQAIVLAAFVLEYRIKRVYDLQGVTYGPTDTLGALLKNFQSRLEATHRSDNGRRVRLPKGFP